MHTTTLTRYPMNSTEAATHLSMSVGHLYNLISAGRGPRHVKYGRQLWFSRADLDRWVAVRCELIESDRPMRE